MNTKYIVSLGEILFDANPQKGILTIGGAPSNWAINCHRLISQKDIRTVVVSAVGNDLLGDAVVDFLDNCNIGSLIARVPDKPTSIVKVSYDKGNNPHYNIVEDVAWDYIGFEDAPPEQQVRLKDIRDNCCAVCWGTLGQRSPKSRQFIQDFVSAITTPNVIKVYDPNIRKKPDAETKKIIYKSLLLANTVKLGHDEVDIIGEIFGLFPAINNTSDENKGTKKDYLKRSKVLFDKFPNINIIIITLSYRGSHIFLRNGETSSMKTRKVKDVKPVGCGDSFLAGVIASLVSGKDLHYAHNKGSEVSRFVAQNDSATPELPQAYIID